MYIMTYVYQYVNHLLPGRLKYMYISSVLEIFNQVLGSIAQFNPCIFDRIVSTSVLCECHDAARMLDRKAKTRGVGLHAAIHHI